MIYTIWLTISAIVFFLYPYFFSQRDMYGFSAATFFFKRLIGSLFMGGVILFGLAMFIQNGNA
jgi:hypothetical protein